MKRITIQVISAALVWMAVCVSCSKDDGPDNTVSVAAVSLNKSSITLTAGGYETLTATVTPAEASNRNVTWSSSAADIASVDASGKVTAVSAGQATIIVSTVDGGKTASCTVTVTAATVAVTGVTLNKETLTLDVGKKETLLATVLPADATEKGVTWKSASDAIATVSANGEVTAVSKGSTTITATTTSGSKTAACAVNVNDNSTPATTLEVSIAGTISHTTYTPGQTGTVTFNRFPATVDEFKQVREKIGGQPHGAVALQLMAYEMYRRNRTIGEECIRLNNVTANVTPAVNRLKELFGNDAYYARPYQIAAFLKGATPANGYNPTKPYTVEMRVAGGMAYQNSNDYQATVLYLEVLTQGKDKGSEQVAVLKTLKPGEPGDGKFFIVFNSPGLYSQVKEVSFANPFKGLD